MAAVPKIKSSDYNPKVQSSSARELVYALGFQLSKKYDIKISASSYK